MDERSSATRAILSKGLPRLMIMFKLILSHFHRVTDRTGQGH
jgi:hypothetical protein